MEVLFYIFQPLAIFYIYALLILGFVQPISAIVRIIMAKRKDSTYAIGLKRYLGYVLCYFLLLNPIIIFTEYTRLEYIGLTYLFFIPAVFAFWYIRYISKWTRKWKNIKDYNTIKSLSAPHPDRIKLESFPTKKYKLSIRKKKNTTLKLNYKDMDTIKSKPELMLMK